MVYSDGLNLKAKGTGGEELLIVEIEMISIADMVGTTILPAMRAR